MMFFIGETVAVNAQTFNESLDPEEDAQLTTGLWEMR